jgi:hypothetical protein
MFILKYDTKKLNFLTVNIQIHQITSLVDNQIKILEIDVLHLVKKNVIREIDTIFKMSNWSPIAKWQ